MTISKRGCTLPMRTSKVMGTVAAGASRPPSVAFAPVPSLNTTRFAPAANSPRSSPSASVTAAPSIRSEFATYVAPAGIGSVRMKLSAPSWPVLRAVTV